MTAEIRKNINRVAHFTLDQKKILHQLLDRAGLGLTSVLEDTTPQLGGHLDTNGNNIQVAGYSTDGIKGPSTYLWKDKEGQINTRGIGAGEPTWAQIDATVFSGYRWAIDDVAWVDYHVPHDYAPNTPVYFHTHWLCGGSNTTNSVKWEFSVSHANGFGQEAYDLANPTVVTAEEVSAGQYYGMVTETAAVDLGITEPDGIIKVRIKRITNGGTNNSDNIFMSIANMHYLSTGIGTVNKAPNFYNTP